LEEALQELDNKAHKARLTINKEKAKYIWENVKRHNQHQRIAIGEYWFERV
jgi:hypothetical protein